MIERRTFKLRDEQGRAWVASFIATVAPIGCFVEVRPPTRSLEQNAALHAALTEIAKQVTWHGVKLDVEDWKRLCTAACLREQGEQVRMVPALDGKGFDIVYARTSKMTKQQLSDLLEWVYAFGAQNGVTFKDRAA